MTTSDERARALVWAGGFLIQISRDQSLPLDLRQRATVIARHFPTIENLRVLRASGYLLETGDEELVQSGLETWPSENAGVGALPRLRRANSRNQLTNFCSEGFIARPLSLASCYSWLASGDGRACLGRAWHLAWY